MLGIYEKENGRVVKHYRFSERESTVALLASSFFVLFILLLTYSSLHVIETDYSNKKKIEALKAEAYYLRQKIEFQENRAETLRIVTEQIMKEEQ